MANELIPILPPVPHTEVKGAFPQWARNLSLSLRGGFQNIAGKFNDLDAEIEAIETQIGEIGEYVQNSQSAGSAVSLTTDTVADVASISLTAGDWNVWGQVGFNCGGTTDFTRLRGGVSIASATFPGIVDNNQASFRYGKAAGTIPGNVNPAFAVPASRMNLTETTTVYLVADALFTAGTVGAFGFIAARRMKPAS